ncbi:hypothetical protein NM688_g4783 [Phlebia brevispora]|uniref:Uncharacterized protein n=1 Tax=Phlebia brevispora TaxID=194682 RepID=A0ACC1T223_9APHY|nr:hypothetical protein NM688_g4783 [Phlebia brevispora]
MAERLALLLKWHCDAQADESAECRGEDLSLEGENEEWIEDDAREDSDVMMDEAERQLTEDFGHIDMRAYYNFSSGHLKYGTHIVCMLLEKH